MEEPQYEEINELELREIEEELGYPVTREIAQWFIRNRINREAVERMLGARQNRIDADTNVQNVRNIKAARNRKPVSILKKGTKTKKCA